MSTETLSRDLAAPTEPFSLRLWIARHREQLMVACLLVAAALFHGLNMFGFPYFENDEGTYMAQAWAIVRLGELAPYTYWYDHAPAGWMQLAAWSLLTGGFHSFGSTNNSGRVLMLLMQVGSTLMVYITVRAVLTPRRDAGRPGDARLWAGAA
jgi:hypothetical protein